MSEQFKHFPEFFLTAPLPCPYLPGRQERKLFTHLTPDKPKVVVDQLLGNGFRRSQSVAYTPYCDECRACVSVRVPWKGFEPGRTMRRIKMRNHDVVARHLPAFPTTEQYGLFRRYIDARHAEGGMSDMGSMDYAEMIEDTTVDTFVTEYRLSADHGHIKKGQLIGVSLQDRLADGLSMVYSFFDPDLTERSLGTYMILDGLARIETQNLPYLYLGYWIDGSDKMAYKARFQPMEMLEDGTWTGKPRGR